MSAVLCPSSLQRGRTRCLPFLPSGELPHSLAHGPSLRPQRAMASLTPSHRHWLPRPPSTARLPSDHTGAARIIQGRLPSQPLGPPPTVTPVALRPQSLRFGRVGRGRPAWGCPACHVGLVLGLLWEASAHTARERVRTRWCWQQKPKHPFLSSHAHPRVLGRTGATDPGWRLGAFPEDPTVTSP